MYIAVYRLIIVVYYIIIIIIVVGARGPIINLSFGHIIIIIIIVIISASRLTGYQPSLNGRGYNI